MFFKKRKIQEDSRRQLEGQLDALSQNAAAVKDSLEHLQGLREEVYGMAQELRQFFTSATEDKDQLQCALNQTTGRLEQQLSQLHSEVHKHDMAIEDLLDEWEEKKSDEESVKARQQESDQTEQLLLGLFEAYQEQFWNLKHYAASKDGSWSAQIALMEINLEHYRRTCAISLIKRSPIFIAVAIYIKERYVRKRGLPHTALPLRLLQTAMKTGVHNKSNRQIRFQPEESQQ